jgi:hypothetical protein
MSTPLAVPRGPGFDPVRMVPYLTDPDDAGGNRAWARDDVTRSITRTILPGTADATDTRNGPVGPHQSVGPILISSKNQRLTASERWWALVRSGTSFGTWNPVRPCRGLPSPSRCTILYVYMWYTQ